MAKMNNPQVTVKAKPNIYTVLTLVALLAVIASLAFGYMALTQPQPNGYGLKFEQIVQPSDNGAAAGDAAKPGDKAATPGAH